MIIKQFLQKRGLFNKKKFTLKKDKLIIEETTIQSKNKYEIDLDKIGYEKYYEAENTTIGKIVTIIFFIIPLFFIGSFILGKSEIGSVILITSLFWFLVVFSLLKSNKDDIFLIGGTKSISFYRNKPNEETVSDFIDEIISVSKQFTKNKYLNIENYASKEDYCYMLKYLSERNVLSKKEFDFLKEESQNRFI